MKKSTNICKFTSVPQLDTLSVICFIQESDQEIMQKSIRLDYHRAILISEGSGHFVFDGVRIPFQTGTLAFGFKNEYFRIQTEENCTCLYISFEGTRADELFRRFEIAKYNRVFPGKDSLLPLWRESLSRASEDTIDLAAESMLLHAFTRISSRQSKQSTLIADILRISDANFHNPNLTLASIAEDLGYNSKYLSSVFRKKMGVTYSDYLKSLRIKYAVTLFDHGIHSVKNVALLSGFSDPLYFSTVFRKDIGVSPKEYTSRLMEKVEQAQQEQS